MLQKCNFVLKGHGNERNFPRFCINRFGQGLLHNISIHSDFGFEFAEIFIFEKRLPISVSWGVHKIAYRYNYFQIIQF